MKLSFKRIFWLSLVAVIALLFIAVFIILNRPAKSLTESEKQQALTKILGRPVVLNEKKFQLEIFCIKESMSHFYIRRQRR